MNSKKHKQSRINANLATFTIHLDYWQEMSEEKVSSHEVFLLEPWSTCWALGLNIHNSNALGLCHGWTALGEISVNTTYLFSSLNADTTCKSARRAVKSRSRPLPLHPGTNTPARKFVPFDHVTAFEQYNWKHHHHLMCYWQCMVHGL